VDSARFQRGRIHEHSYFRTKAELELGKHWISKELVGVRLNKKANGLYGEGMMSNLYELDQPWSVDILDIVSGEAI
jgi:hypothetical protein